MASIKGSCTLFLFLQLKIDTFLFILTNPLTFRHTLWQIRLDSVKAQNSAQKSFFFFVETRPKLPAGFHTWSNITFLKLIFFSSKIYIYQCIYIMNVFFYFVSFWSAIIPCCLHQAHSAFWEWQLLTLHIIFIIDIMLK